MLPPDVSLCVHVTSIQFILSTRVSGSSGDWPEEYHLAAARLYAMFDAIEGQFVAQQLNEHVAWSSDDSGATALVKPIVDSLTSDCLTQKKLPLIEDRCLTYHTC